MSDVQKNPTSDSLCHECGKQHVPNAETVAAIKEHLADKAASTHTSFSSVYEMYAELELPIPGETDFDENRPTRACSSHPRR